MRLWPAGTGPSGWRQVVANQIDSCHCLLCVLQVKDAGRGGASLGVAYFYAMAAKDGSTLFWACDRAGNPIAKRW